MYKKKHLSVRAEWLEFLFYTLEVLDSNLGPETSYQDKFPVHPGKSQVHTAI
jgi:hypothetical protein